MCFSDFLKSFLLSWIGIQCLQGLKKKCNLDLFVSLFIIEHSLSSIPAPFAPKDMGKPHQLFPSSVVQLLAYLCHQNFILLFHVFFIIFFSHISRQAFPVFHQINIFASMCMFWILSITKFLVYFILVVKTQASGLLSFSPSIDLISLDLDMLLLVYI